VVVVATVVAVVAVVCGGSVVGVLPSVGVVAGGAAEPGVGTPPADPLPPITAVPCDARERPEAFDAERNAPFAEPPGRSAAGSATALLPLPSRAAEAEGAGSRPRSARCNAGNVAEPVNPITTSTT
jgi:hypothetical protein